MNYLRPKENTTLGKGITITYGEDEFIEDPITKINIPYHVSYMEYIDGDVSKGIKIEFNAGLNKVTEDVRKKQKKFIEIKHSCIRVAEILNESLRNFILRYYEEKKKDERELVYNLEFMKLRDKLSNIIKEDDRFKNIEILAKTVSRKNFTKTFFAFIEDRNIYTHGHLHIRINDNQVILTYIDQKYNNQTSCIINEEIIQSYFDTYKIFSETLGKMHAIII